VGKPAHRTFVCPNCGTEVRSGVRSCPECGSDEETGWSDDTMYDGLDLPDPGYAEDEAPTPPRKGATRAYAIAAALMLLMLAAAAVGRFAHLW
jgi:zinc-ribbon domain